MVDVYSDTWLEIKALVEKRGTQATEAVVMYGMDERKADYNRGVLAMCREVLKMEKVKDEST